VISSCRERYPANQPNGKEKWSVKTGKRDDSRSPMVNVADRAAPGVTFNMESRVSGMVCACKLSEWWRLRAGTSSKDYVIRVWKASEEQTWGDRQSAGKRRVMQGETKEPGVLRCDADRWDGTTRIIALERGQWQRRNQHRWKGGLYDEARA